MIKNRLLLFINILLLVLLISCNKSDTSNTETIKVLDVNRQLNFEVHKSEDGITVNQLSAENYLKKRFSLENIVSYKDFKYSYNPSLSQGVITMVGVDDTNQRWPIGVEFKIQNNKLESGPVGSTGTGHSCEGNPCSCCDFIYKSDGTTVKGCKCDTTTDEADECVNLVDVVRCNHTNSQ